MILLEQPGTSGLATTRLLQTQTYKSPRDPCNEQRPRHQYGTMGGGASTGVSANAAEQVQEVLPWVEETDEKEGKRSVTFTKKELRHLEKVSRLCPRCVRPLSNARTITEVQRAGP